MQLNNIKIDFKPKTISGKWAVRLGLALVILTALSLIFASAIGGDSAVIEASPMLTVLAGILSILFTLVGPLSFVMGVYTIIKYREWSIWKPLVILYILVLLMFLLGEFLSPY